MQAFLALVERRKNHEPVAYILGTKDFYGRPFFVSSDVLIPRPSTEGLVTCALDFLRTQQDEICEVDSGIVAVSKRLGDLSSVRTVADIGTGSGCIAITLALALPEFHIIATDVHTEALAVARRNAGKHNVLEQMELRAGSLLEPLLHCTEPFIVVSNPPYIPAREDVMDDVAQFEPAHALYGGETGSDLLLALWQQAKETPMCRGCVFECRAEQAKEIL